MRILFLSCFFLCFLAQVPCVVVATDSAPRYLANKRIRTNFCSGYGEPVREKERLENIALFRASSWQHRQIDIPSVSGKTLSVALHFADFAFFDKRRSNSLTHYAVAAAISVYEDNVYRIAWIGYLPQLLAPEQAATCFIEVDGNVLLCQGRYRDTLGLSRGILMTHAQKVPFSDSEVELERVILSTAQGEVSTINSSFPLEYAFDNCFFFEGIWSARLGDFVCKNAVVEDCILCIEIENVKYPRKGRVWVDMRKKKLIRSEDLTDEAILAKVPRIRWETPPREL